MAKIQSFFGDDYFFDYNQWEIQFKKDMLRHAKNAAELNSSEDVPYKFEYQGAQFVIWNGLGFLDNVKKNFYKNSKNFKDFYKSL